MVETLDNEDELKAMADYYGQSYDEVYFVRDLVANFIVAVECYPAKNGAVVSRNGRKMNCYPYKSRLLASRERLDKAPSGKPMIGYESISGNDTRLGKVELGVVDEQPLSTEAITAAELGVSSPFERFQKEQEIAATQLLSGPADYELTTKSDGMTVERFETFAVERVK